MAEIQSKPYKPDPRQCCEACAFGTGQHANWCRPCLFWGCQKSVAAHSLFCRQHQAYVHYEAIEHDEDRAGPHHAKGQ